MSPRRQTLAVVLLVVLLLPLGLAGLGGRAGFGMVELAVWLVVVSALVVAFVTWGRGARDATRRERAGRDDPDGA